MLGGVYSLDAGAEAKWGLADRWQFPIGDPRQLGSPGGPGEPGFQVLRNIEWTHGRPSHQGVDLGDGREGDPVRAAARGIVLLAQEDDGTQAYGGRIVLAHRLASGRFAYTVYAHLAKGSIEVEPGDLVEAGDRIANVGRTGNASTPHLHFEVRDVPDPSVRWEKEPVRDPLAFVRTHAEGEPEASEPSGSVADVYVRWAGRESLVGEDADATATLTRSAWWRMVAATVARGPSVLDADPESLRDSLVELGVLPEEAAASDAAHALPWKELARDVRRMRDVGVRPGPGPLPAKPHGRACVRLVGMRAPAAHAASLRHRHGEPTLAQGCVVLADLHPPQPAPAHAHHAAAKRSRRRRAR
jgi:murein DD-endopeptidase MepM/ murein hydrolase activator NlpD